MRLCEPPLIPVERIQKHVAELAAAIDGDADGRDYVLMAVLKGAMYFAADLSRRLETPHRLEFCRAQSYAGNESTGQVHIPIWPEKSIAGQRVLLVEDILDTGRTTAAILQRLKQEGAADTHVCALLNKPSRRVIPIPEDYVGLTIGDHFVVGYGLDYEERYRGLEAIHVLEDDGSADLDSA
ncbi:MAG: hypoxanthine phosphoribosyltransferase [Candidatus Hydrogenedentota bacterium]